jgi:TRAP-type C4-dicarboxylate transport system permease small subunit
MTKRAATTWEKVGEFWRKAEELLLCLLLVGMISFACLQIILRTFFASGLVWIEPLLRYLVVWCGFLGAVVATGQGKHICLDLYSKNLSESGQRWLKIAIDLFGFSVTAVLSWASYRFLVEEYRYAGEELLQIPLWIWNGVFLLAFLMMAGKFLFMFFAGLFPSSSLPKKTTEQVS